MPSFLSKVFGGGGRKKDSHGETSRKDGKTSAPVRPPSQASLLEGKFEAVPPVITPITTSFDLPSARKSSNGRNLDYHLSLNLPGPKESPTRALGVVFETDPESQIQLADSGVGEGRLTPSEALLLIQACSQAITSRGLETLGIMIPHWYSASPEVQQRLITLFIQSVRTASPITALSPSPPSPATAFESEVDSTRPHDVAAVLRWGLRHLSLDNSTFGKDEGWYTQFLNNERAANYPPKAFSDKLVPLLPPAHLHVLVASLELFSSLAAHSEANSISGSKLSKMFGLWMLSATRALDGDDYPAFYARWEKWGRIMEHLFLARIRDDAIDRRQPTRLAELVKHYPFTKSGSPTVDSAFLPVPRFSTRHFDALYLVVETEAPTGTSSQAKNHPLRLIADALKASTTAITSELTSSKVVLWETFKRHISVADTDSDSYPGLSSLFSDETIRFLSLIPMLSESSSKSSTPFTISLPQVGRRRSMSLGARDQAKAALANLHARTSSVASTAQDSPVPSPAADGVGFDWASFSNSGFFSDDSQFPGSKLAASLLDNRDVEVTAPPRRSNSKRKIPPPLIPLPSSRGKSLDLPSPDGTPPQTAVNPSATADKVAAPTKGKSRVSKLEIVELDEAFVDFWTDALLDPISAGWPSFIVAKIKPSVPAEVDGKKIGWLIVEQRFSKPASPPKVTIPPMEKQISSSPSMAPTHSSSRPNSPRPSIGSESKASKKKRFSFFTSISSSSVTSATSGKKRAATGPGSRVKVGEMGEVLQEEEETPSSSSKTAGIVTGAAAAGAAAIGGAAAVAAAVELSSKSEASPPVAALEKPAPAPVDRPAAPAETVAPTEPEPAAVVVEAPADVAQIPALAKEEIIPTVEPASDVLAEDPEPVGATGAAATEEVVSEPVLESAPTIEAGGHTIVADEPQPVIAETPADHEPIAPVAVAVAEEAPLEAEVVATEPEESVAVPLLEAPADVEVAPVAEPHPIVEETAAQLEPEVQAPAAEPEPEVPAVEAASLEDEAPIESEATVGTVEGAPEPVEAVDVPLAEPVIDEPMVVDELAAEESAVVESEVVKPEVVEPKAVEPEVVEAGVEPEVAEPEVAEPEIVEPETSQLGTVQSAVENPVIDTAPVESHVPESAIEQPTVEEPAVDLAPVETDVVVPAVEQQIVEEPAVDEAPPAEPAPVEPVVEEPVDTAAVVQPAVEESAIEEPATEEAVSFEAEPAVHDIAVADEPVIEDTAVDEPVAEPAVAVSEPEVEPIAAVSESAVEEPAAVDPPVVEESPILEESVATEEPRIVEPLAVEETGVVEPVAVETQEPEPESAIVESETVEPAPPAVEDSAPEAPAVADSKPEEPVIPDPVTEEHVVEADTTVEDVPPSEPSAVEEPRLQGPPEISVPEAEPIEVIEPTTEAALEEAVPAVEEATTEPAVEEPVVEEPPVVAEPEATPASEAAAPVEPQSVAEPESIAVVPTEHEVELPTKPVLVAVDSQSSIEEAPVSTEPLPDHTEPLREPDSANDDLVALPSVPVVESRPDLVRGETVISHLELTPAPSVAQVTENHESMLSAGETLGPAASLDVAEPEKPENDHVPADI